MNSNEYKAALPELEAAYLHYVEATTAVGRCDRVAAEAAVTKLYQLHGHRAPAFAWFDSPTTGFAAIALCDLVSNLGGFKKLLSTTLQVLKNAGKQPEEPDWLLANQLGLSDSSDIDRKKLYAIYETLSTGSPFIWRRRLQAYITTVRRTAIDQANLKLEYSRSEALLSICDTIRESVTAMPEARRCWNELADTIGRLDSVSYQNKITSRRHYNNFQGCFVSRGGYDLDNLVTPLELLQHSEKALLAIMGEPVPPGFAELTDALMSCPWWYPTSGLCIMIERPTELHLDADGVLHNESGPAVRFADGQAVHCWRGVIVPESVIKMQFGPNDISNQPNLEVRRIMLERYGAARYLQASGVRPKHRDECGVLYELPQNRDEPLVMVRVTNSTPEPDGTFKEYFLRVPPTMRRAREAVAWTFGLSDAEYHPAAES